MKTMQIGAIVALSLALGLGFTVLASGFSPRSMLSPGGGMMGGGMMGGGMMGGGMMGGPSGECGEHMDEQGCMTGGHMSGCGAASNDCPLHDGADRCERPGDCSASQGHYDCGRTHRGCC